MISRAQKIDLIQSLVNMKYDISQQSDALKTIFGISLDFDVGIPKLIDDLFQTNLDLVAQLTGISKDNIGWFIVDSECDKSNVAECIVEQFVDLETGVAVDGLNK